MSITSLKVTPTTHGFTATWTLTGKPGVEIIVMWRPHGGTIWQASGIAKTATTCAINGLTAGRTYDVRVLTDAGDANASVSTPPQAPPPAPAVTALGIAVGTIQNEDAATLARDLDAIKAAGAKWFRCDINWAQVQVRGPSSYNWTSDAAIQGALARGMKILATIAYAPSWARTTGQVDAAAYGAFVKTAVTHYQPWGVHAYELWNEPNGAWGWGMTPNPAVYTACLKAGYTAAKQADPACTIVSAGLSPAATDGTNFSPCDFLTAMYANGAYGSFDALGHHPYCNAPAGADYDWSAWWQMTGATTSLRSIMAANGDATKPVWITEFGYATAGPDAQTPANQASRLTQAIQLAKTYSWCPVMCIYNHRDTTAHPTTGNDSYGLLANDFTPKPAYAAYQQAAAQ